MPAHKDSGRPGGASADAALLSQLLADVPAAAAPPPWAAPARLAAVSARRAVPAWPGSLPLARRPLAVAAAALLAGGLVASSVGAAPVRAAAAAAPALAAPAAAARPATGALSGMRLAPAADEALLARLLAAPVAADDATGAYARAAHARPAALPAFELAAAVAPATVSLLPAAATDYQLSPLALPAVTVAAQQRNYPQNAPVPPPPPPSQGSQGQQQQPPPPPGYQQPPGYQDGVPFGGQIGAVPGSRPAARPPARPAQPTRPGQVVTRPVQAVHIVRAGDTLAAIALRYYGDARYADLIWETNIRVIGINPNVIVPGQRLVLPGIVVQAPVARPPAVVGPLPTTAIAPRSFYTIQPRDFLRWMSLRAYGNERFWPEIYGANRNVLGPNPDLIYPGVRVYIP
jgi:nucleoid-associated protein YgaU